MGRIIPAAAARSRSVMMAVVMGTAMTTAADSAQAAVTVPSDRAIEDINRYCTTCWRNARLPADRWSDCTQQVFTRLLERVEPRKWSNILSAEGEERREFLRAIDAVKKRTQRDRKYNGLTPDVPDWRTETADTWDKREALAQAATRVLSERQRRIVELTAGGWAVPEIALELGTTAERISDEKYKAIRKLRNYFGVE
jgi:RNA polymerase sigma factor (sigma-70 family)